jgi:threonine synthase
MRYYSTNGKAPLASLREAVVNGLAPDRGLYMPERIKPMPKAFFRDLPKLDLPETAFAVATNFFGEDVDPEALERIVYGALNFRIPVVEVSSRICSLELFHGPTLAFKDVGARFMARLLAYFNQDESREVNVLVATSGDTGSAVANGFLGVEGVRVFVLYPKGRVSPIQECQFTTLGQNITALEIDGSFDDCQALVKSAFMDPDLTARMKLTSANSINVVRFLPQSFYYFHGVGQMQQKGRGEDLVICVPSGNFGNLCSALFAVRMGLPVKRMIAANNRNDVFFKYLQTGQYIPRPSIATLANAMDVGDPSNFARILDLYDGDWNAIRAFLSGQSVDDDTILSTIRDCRWQTGYILDPHGACAYRALADGLRDGENGLFCETAHPAKFKDTVEEATDQPVGIPGRLAAFMRGEKKSVPLPADFQAFKAYLSSI